MKLLVDTHCWLWMLREPERLGERARGILENRGNQVYFSAASSWEIAIKVALGKLDLGDPPSRFVPKVMASLGILSLPVEHAHALAVASLPPHHRDPFDRLLVAQAIVEKLPILTADPKLGAYDVEILWAIGPGKPIGVREGSPAQSARKASSRKGRGTLDPKRRL